MSAKLGELVSGIKKAIVEAHRSVGAQHMDELEHFFEYAGDQQPPPKFPHGSWRPKIVQVSVPREVSRNGKMIHEDHLVSVPLITLLPIRSFTIDRAEILTQVNLGLADNDKLMANAPTDAEQPSSDWQKPGLPDVTVQLSPTGEQSAELKLVIHGLDAPPGIHRLVGAYEKLLNAQLPT